MFNLSTKIVRCLRSLVLLVAVLGFLIACGGPTPTPEVLVVTSTFTPEPVVLVVTSTFTPTTEVTATATPTTEPTSTPEPTATPTTEPTSTPEPTATLEPELEFVTYEHPSGAFSLDIPQDAEYSEEEDGIFFTDGESLAMIFFVLLEAPLDPAELEQVAPIVLDESLVGEDLILSYSDLEVEGSETGDLFAATFAMTSEEFGDGEGRLILWQREQTLYVLVLLTPDYAGVEQVWTTVLGSFAGTSIAPTTPPEPPTDTPAPTNTPEPTKKPKPKKPTATPKPPPSANQGCYLFENQLGADVTVTFTARDWQWSDSFSVAANGTKEYCLDPGRYTYTIDAPPPWGSVNGELEVKAGDRFRWPIRGN